MDKSNTRILVVDDDAVILEIASWTLANLGYSHVETASDGNIGIAKMLTAELPFDIVISDLNMPAMNGVEFSRTAIEERFSGGIVLVSGEDEKLLDIASGLIEESEATLLGTLAKPLDSAALQDLLDDFHQRLQVAPAAHKPTSLKRRELEQGIREQDALLLTCQPVLRLGSGELVGVEAMPRWRQPGKGILHQSDFVPLARQSGLIVELSEAIVCLALEQISDWRSAGQALEVWLSLATDAFSTAAFRKLLISKAAAAAVEPGKITLGLSQGTIDPDDSAILEGLMELRLAGFNLAIDDFRPGETATELLHSAPFTKVRIEMDRFAMVAGDNPNPAEFAHCLELASESGVQLAAKKVTGQALANQAELLGCELVQGDLYGAPVIAGRVLSMLQEWQT